MAIKIGTDNGTTRNWLALGILGISAVAILALGITVIWLDKEGKSAMQIFNATLPVFSSWVGTVLAFYFGRENFEAANEKVSVLLDKLPSGQRASAPAESVMRKLSDITLQQLTAAQGEAQVTLKDLRAKLVGDVSRLPVIDANGCPLYLVHGSMIDRHLADGGKDSDTLAALLDKDDNRTAFGPRRGFVLAAEKDTLATAKIRMEAVQGCQDIFITVDGSEKRPLLGWISNTRLGKFLQA